MHLVGCLYYCFTCCCLHMVSYTLLFAYGVLHVVVCIWCLTCCCLHMVSYMLLFSYGVLRVVVCIWCLTCCCLHMVSYMLLFAYGVLHVVVCIWCLTPAWTSSFIHSVCCHSMIILWRSFKTNVWEDDQWRMFNVHAEKQGRTMAWSECLRQNFHSRSNLWSVRTRAIFIQLQVRIITAPVPKRLFFFKVGIYL